MRFFVRKSCGKSHFFLVEKSIVVYKTEGSEKYVCEKRRVDLGGPLECESNACKKKEVEMGGIDPPTPRMRIECSTI